MERAIRINQQQSGELLSFPLGKKEAAPALMYFIFVLCCLCSSSRVLRVKTRGGRTCYNRTIEILWLRLPYLCYVKLFI